MKTAEDFIREMGSSETMKHECTFHEYADQIGQFQESVCKMIAGDNYYEDMRIEEAQIIMESIARRNELWKHPVVFKGIQSMKIMSKEMAITLSGARAENLVCKTLEYLNRPNTKIFRNVYISDGNEETELDAVVLTDSGVIILEMKNVTSDLTLTKDGRMVFSHDECYDKIPLCEKMAIKRRLLKKRLNQIIEEKGLNIPVFVDSFIVFCAPKGQYIHITDNYHREKYCFRTTLNKKIENYLGCAYYKDEQLNQLGTIFSELESNVKRFENDINLYEIRHNIAEAMVVLQDASDVRKTSFANYIDTMRAKMVNNAPELERDDSELKHTTFKHKFSELRSKVDSATNGDKIVFASMVGCFLVSYAYTCFRKNLFRI